MISNEVLFIEEIKKLAFYSRYEQFLSNSIDRSVQEIGRMALLVGKLAVATFIVRTQSKSVDRDRMRSAVSGSVCINKFFHIFSFGILSYGLFPTYLKTYLILNTFEISFEVFKSILILKPF